MNLNSCEYLRFLCGLSGAIELMQSARTLRDVRFMGENLRFNKRFFELIVYDLRAKVNLCLAI